MPRSDQKGMAAMSCRKRVVWQWCGVIPAALLPHGLRGGLGTAQQGGRPRASCAGEGVAWPCVAELQKSGRVRWWLLLDDNEYEAEAAEHGSNSLSAYAVSDHGLKSISLHQQKLPLLCCFPHHGSVVNQARESMQSKNNWAGRDSAAMAHHTTEGNARQNVPTGRKQKHCMFWVVDGTWKPTKSWFYTFFGCCWNVSSFVWTLFPCRGGLGLVYWDILPLDGYLTMWGDTPKCAALGSFSLWLLSLHA